ncbi:unnamed protein product [Dicrocoelium dendriticum]|nr:unnamed protein product [Dicrocoelium dendriticum]
MASFQKLKLSLTWPRVTFSVITAANATQSAVNRLPAFSAAIVETECERWNNLTSSLWRLRWRIVAAISRTAPAAEYSQKSMWNAFTRSYPQYSGWSSSTVVLVVVVVVVTAVLPWDTRTVNITCTCVRCHPPKQLVLIIRYVWCCTFGINNRTSTSPTCLSSSFYYFKGVKGAPSIQQPKLSSTVLLHTCSRQINCAISLGTAHAPQSSRGVTFVSHNALIKQPKLPYSSQRSFGKYTQLLFWWIYLSVMCLYVTAHQSERRTQNPSAETPYSRFPSVPSIGRSSPVVEGKTDNLRLTDADPHETPRYMFKMHERHKREWWDYGQFEDNCLTHPMYRQLSSASGTSEGVQIMGRLGAVTAVRHHKHVDTTEWHPIYSSQMLSQKRRSFHLSSTHRPTEHRLLFQLADMPPNEHLLAASIRLRYVPGDHAYGSKSGRSHRRCHSATRYHQWPILMWLHYSQPHQKARFDVQTVGWFEPDVTLCYQSIDESKRALLHLPSGWFNVPLSQAVLDMLKSVSAMPTDGPKLVSIQVLSVTSKLHTNESRENQLRVKRNTLDSQLSEHWLHEAPHLITFHRDPTLVEYVKRTRRSVPEATVTDSANAATGPDSGLRSKLRNGNSFAEQPKMFASVVDSKLSGPPQKVRRRRRALQQRHRSRQSRGYWNANDAPRKPSQYQYYADNDGGNSGSDEIYGGGTRKSDQYTYESQPNFDQPELPINSPNYLETVCQRRELIIDFAAIGWSGWVIAPRTYNARYCRGHCPFPLSTHYNTTNHAILLQLVHLLDVARTTGPCCVPNQLSSQSLLYHSQKGDVVLRVYQDMVVESCACR